MAEHLVDEEKEHRGHDHHGENHGGGDASLLARRPGDFAHFLADLPQKFQRGDLAMTMPLGRLPYIALAAPELASL